MRTLIVLCTAAILVTCPINATASQPAASQATELRAKLKRMTRDRDRWRARARTARDQLTDSRDALADARAALHAPLANQIAALAAVGSLASAHTAVLEPLRAGWRCGASLFQGEAFWSLTLNATDLRLVDGELQTFSCP